MKQFLTLLSLTLCLSTAIHAQQEKQATPKLYVGYGLFMNYNLYCWYQKTSQADLSLSSSGQVFNVLPGLGFNVWFGDVDRWILSIESAIEYAPFALDLAHYKGMGALSIPILAKAQFPIAKQQSLWLMLHVGAGAQLSKTELSARPPTHQNVFNPFFTTVIGEVGFHISAVGYRRQHIREVELFIRAGVGALGAVSFNSGLRMTFWNRFGK
ncbi:hypothetical protein [Aureispira anguillae]|uniref:Outer membrane protein beta-barrel domain-containing protein n=1 Tax=Aureispira anguillae TaxID=2864201 RepID=A0A916DUY0_9BACT|nr:hypothetical protein [Aureispira anguillae]BDS12626.1 hypothetical protein AsAng_0033500 [Aureispira anguillae]